MSQKINRDRDPAMMKHIIVKQGDSFVKLVMPPMDKEAKLDHKRCTAYLLDMIIKYGPALEVEKNQKKLQTLQSDMRKSHSLSRVAF